MAVADSAGTKCERDYGKHKSHRFVECIYGKRERKSGGGSYPGTCGGESATCNGDNRGGKRQSGRTIPHAAWNDAWVVCVYYFIQSFKSFEYTDHQYGHKKTGICDAAVHRNVGKTIISDGTE